MELNIITSAGEKLAVTRDQIPQLKTADLVEVHNAVFEQQIAGWKSKKSILVEKIMLELQPAKPEKPAKAKKERKPRALSKSWRLLKRLAEGPCTVEALMILLETSKGSVNSYASYFRNGLKGHPKVEMRVVAGKLDVVSTEDAVAALKEKGIEL